MGLIRKALKKLAEMGREPASNADVIQAFFVSFAAGMAFLALWLWLT